jgi:alkylhydroperoxidase family enzyme
MRSDDEADEVLAPLLEQARDPANGEVDEILRVHSLHPAGLAAHLALYRAVMRGTAGLRKVERELIAFVVSRLNGCHY